MAAGQLQLDVQLQQCDAYGAVSYHAVADEGYGSMALYSGLYDIGQLDSGLLCFVLDHRVAVVDEVADSDHVPDTQRQQQQQQQQWHQQHKDRRHEGT